MLPLETEGIDLGPLLPEHLSEIIVGIVLFADHLVGGGEEGRAGLREDLRRAHRRDLRRDREGRGCPATGRRGSRRVHRRSWPPLAPRPVASARTPRRRRSRSLPRSREQAQADSARMLASAKAQIEAERAQVVHQLRGRGRWPGHRSSPDASSASRWRTTSAPGAASTGSSPTWKPRSRRGTRHERRRRGPAVRARPGAGRPRAQPGPGGGALRRRRPARRSGAAAQRAR